MANNRLFLCCKRTGQKVLIAKYYPVTGWYVLEPDTLGSRLNKMFDADEFGGMTDGQSHFLEYEEDETHEEQLEREKHFAQRFKENGGNFQEAYDFSNRKET